jgi:hypothetical protein
MLLSQPPRQPASWLIFDVRQKNKQSMSYPNEIATLWYPDEAEYQSYQKASAAHDPMHPYKVWLERAEAAIKDHEKKGIRIVKVYAKAEAFVAFCRTQKIHPDSKARSFFAAVLHKKEEGMRN